MTMSAVVVSRSARLIIGEWVGAPCPLISPTTRKFWVHYCLEDSPSFFSFLLVIYALTPKRVHVFFFIFIYPNSFLIIKKEHVITSTHISFES